MLVIVQVSMDVADKLQISGSSVTESQEILQITDGLSVRLKPMHPDTDDPLLSQLFSIEVPDRRTAERVIAGLKNCKAIQAVYLKPLDELPHEAK